MYNFFNAIKYYLKRSNEKVARKLRFIVRTSLFFKASKEWYSYIFIKFENCSPKFVLSLFEQVHRKHFDNRLTSNQISTLLINHYELLQKKTTSQIFSKLINLNEVCLATCNGKQHSYKITLGIDFQFHKEGSLTLKLYIGDIRLVCFAFSLGYIDDKEAILIGCIQSTNKNTIENLRQSTKDLYGKQPRLLLMKVLQLVATNWNIKTIKAIDIKNHPYKSNKKDSQKIHIDYSELWKLAGGIATEDGNYLLPINFKLKNIKNCESKKRAKYIKQNEIMIEIDKQLKNSQTLL